MMLGLQRNRGLSTAEFAAFGNPKPMRDHVFKVALLIGVVWGTIALAETRRFYDAAGHPQGRSESQGNLTRYYDKDGHPAGRSEVGSNGVVRHYDKDGHPQGETSTPRH